MHAILGSAIPTLVLLHVLSAFAFVLLHGPSVAAMLMLRRERELARVQTILTMSRQASELSWTGWGALAITGGLLAFAQHTWGQPWLWGSIVVLVLVTGSMSPLAANAFNHAREAAGLPWFDGRHRRPACAPEPAALTAALDRIRARTLPVMLIGVVGLAVLVWLMVARPG